MKEEKENIISCLLDIEDRIVWLMSANDLLAATSVANAHGELGQEALYALVKLYETITDELESDIDALQVLFKKEVEQE